MLAQEEFERKELNKKQKKKESKGKMLNERVCSQVHTALGYF